MRNQLIRKLTLAMTVMLVTLAGASYAQDSTEAQTRKTVKVKKQVRTASLAVDPVAQLTADIKQCGMPCKVGASGTIASPDGGGTRDYNCDDDGNCACFGASDCVKMTDVCKEGTMGCNDQGCICEEDPDSGG